MSSAVATNITPMPWGKASAKRGRRATQAAMDFLAAFPLGTQLSTEQFDQWAGSYIQPDGTPLLDLSNLSTPAANTPRDSDAWAAHVQRRQALRARINHAASHPRLTLLGSAPFSIEVVAQEVYSVKEPHTAAFESRAAERVISFQKTQLKRLDYWFQGTPWDKLPPFERALAESFRGRYTTTAKTLQAMTDGMEAEFTNIRKRIEEYGVTPSPAQGLLPLSAGSLDPMDSFGPDEDEDEAPEGSEEPPAA